MLISSSGHSFDFRRWRSRVAGRIGRIDPADAVCHQAPWLKMSQVLQKLGKKRTDIGQFGLLQPIGSMYAIYGNICHQYTPNVSIYTIHGSYGQELGITNLCQVSSIKLKKNWMTVVPHPPISIAMPTCFVYLSRVGSRVQGLMEVGKTLLLGWLGLLQGLLRRNREFYRGVL